MNTPPVPMISSLPLDAVLPLVFYIIVLVYVVFTAILYYHWQTYSANPRVSYLTYVTYFILSLPTIVVLAGATIL